jgi:DnaJ-class molecular chaperone
MEIIICRTCQGTGEIREDVGTHQSEYEYHKCKKCNGTGRVKTRSYRYEVPYDMDDNMIYKVDAQIIELIRNLEKKS